MRQGASIVKVNESIVHKLIARHAAILYRLNEERSNCIAWKCTIEWKSRSFRLEETSLDRWYFTIDDAFHVFVGILKGKIQSLSLTFLRTVSISCSISTPVNQETTKQSVIVTVEWPAASLFQPVDGLISSDWNKIKERQGNVLYRLRLSLKYWNFLVDNSILSSNPCFTIKTTNRWIASNLTVV